MNSFLMHIGATNAIDVDYTVKRQRTVKEVLDELPSNAPEREFFESDGPFKRAFPDGRFHCWGIPPKAYPAHKITEIGDPVYFIPHIGLHGGGVTHIGVVRAICRVEAWHASRILWPDTPEQRLFPWLFFFEAETGFRPWYEFLDDLGYGHRFNPRGWYRRIDEEHFLSHGGQREFLSHIRQKGHFTPIGRNA